MSNINDTIKEKLISVFKSSTKESVPGNGSGWVNLVKFAPALKQEGVDFHILGYYKLADFIDATGLFDTCYDNTKSIPPKYIRLKSRVSSTSNTPSVRRREDSLEVSKIKKRFRNGLFKKK